jgi:hypothetical protein
MQNVVFSIDNKTDMQIILRIIKQFGYEPLIISDFEKQMQTRKELVKIASENPKTTISDSEITKALKESRKQKNVKKK